MHPRQAGIDVNLCSVISRPMARTKGSSGATTKPRIRAAAARLLAERGFDGLTMRGIGAEVGLRAGAIYRYFPDKAALAADVLTEALAERDKVLGNVDRSQGPTHALEDLATSYLSWRMQPEGHADLIRLCLPALGATGDALSAAALSPVSEIEAILASGQDEGDFRVPDTQVTARVILAVLDEIAIDTRLTQERRARIGWSLIRRLVRA